jgi:hypothetical protein
MPRSSKENRYPLADAEAAIIGLANGPFDFVADALRNTVEIAKVANSHGEMRDDELKALAIEIRKIVSVVPKSCGPRFWFDAGLIRAMSTGWSEKQLFSSAIIPSYNSEWGYARIGMPLSEIRSPTRPDKAHVIEILFLPGRDDLANIDLLRYPLIAHELAHSLMFRHDNILIPMINSAVTLPVQKLRLAAIADRGRARAISQKVISRFVDVWTPTANHRNWSHEVVADLIGVWVLGPSYLSVFEDLLADEGQDPFKISPIHPPYAVRVKALLTAVERLRLSKYARALQTISSGWIMSRWGSKRTNQYRSLASAEVIDSLVEGAFGFCDQLKLRPWGESKQITADAVRDPAICELGSDLLTIAWGVFLRRGPKGYEDWEAKTIAAITDSSDGDSTDSV